MIKKTGFRFTPLQDSATTRNKYYNSLIKL
jgi:hypothetical protein